MASKKKKDKKRKNEMLSKIVIANHHSISHKLVQPGLDKANVCDNRETDRSAWKKSEGS
jgi:hypothetical protein